MARHHQPRKGSVAFSPRKRSAKETPRIKSWPMADEPRLLGLAGYKVGMTHVMMVDNTKNSPTEGMEISTPVTILKNIIKMLQWKRSKKIWNTWLRYEF